MCFASTWSPCRLGSSVGIKNRGMKPNTFPPYGTKIKSQQKIAYGEPVLHFLTDFFLVKFHSQIYKYHNT